MYNSLYKELANTIQEQIPEVLWIDLWHNQVNFLEEEFPFRTPAIFLSFRTIGTQDLGQLAQQVNLQVDFYLFYETFNDTYHGGFNQDSALEFLTLKDKIHQYFHGSDGQYYTNMRRIDFSHISLINKTLLRNIFFEKTKLSRGLLDTDKLDKEVGADKITNILVAFPELNIT